MKIAKDLPRTSSANILAMGRKLAVMSCLIGGAILSTSASAHADWAFVGLLSNYRAVPNFDACQYRAELVYPSIMGEVHSDSVVFTSRYKYRGVGTGKASGNLDALEGAAPSFTSNHISLANLFLRPDLNNNDALIGNSVYSAETFEIRFSSDGRGARRPSEAWIKFNIPFNHPSTGRVDYALVNTKNVKLFEDCKSSMVK